MLKGRDRALSSLQRQAIFDRVVDKINAVNPLDLSAIRTLIDRFESAVRLGNYMTANKSSIPRREVPVISIDMIDRNTYYHYFTIVTTINSLTSEIARTPVNVVSTQRLAYDQVKAMAEDIIKKNKIEREYRNAIGPKKGIDFVDVIIVSMHISAAAE